tara:strand:+ start:24952 stop:25485 length:534 start_codon:yes stop_codon:yes gene_type:complete
MEIRPALVGGSTGMIVGAIVGMMVAARNKKNAPSPLSRSGGSVSDAPTPERGIDSAALLAEQSDSAVVGRIAESDVDLRELLMDLASVRGGEATKKFEQLVKHLNDLVDLGVEVQINTGEVNHMISASHISAHALIAMKNLKSRLGGDKLEHYNDLQSRLEAAIEDRVSAIVSSASP